MSYPFIVTKKNLARMTPKHIQTFYERKTLLFSRTDIANPDEDTQI